MDREVGEREGQRYRWQSGDEQRVSPVLVVRHVDLEIPIVDSPARVARLYHDIAAAAMRSERWSRTRFPYTQMNTIRI